MEKVKVVIVIAAGLSIIDSAFAAERLLLVTPLSQNWYANSFINSSNPRADLAKAPMVYTTGEVDSLLADASDKQNKILEGFLDMLRRLSDENDQLKTRILMLETSAQK